MKDDSASKTQIK